VIKEKSHIHSNWQAKSSFDDFIEEHKLLTLMGIDTRTLAVHLRNKGQMLGIISTQVSELKELLKKIQEFRQQPIKTILPEISVKKPLPLSKGRKIAVLDLGVTQGLIKQLENLGLSLILLPYNISAKEILRLKPRGLIISNGPEEDGGLKEVIANVKGLLGKLPILGISTGHQVLAAALGAKVVKMKLGHRGVNYPVYNPKSYKGEITVQNHSWVVDTDSLSKIKGLNLTAYNLNDRSIEEMESKKLKLMSIQYYPSIPGFNEVNPALKKFSKMLTKE
jgi:carbamoyl-phosphate synthase small subunit